MHGKIVKGIAGFYYVHAGEQVYECNARGLFRKDKIKPLVGDNVLFDEGLITDIDDRKNRATPGKEKDMFAVRFSLSQKKNMELKSSYYYLDRHSARSYKAKKNLCAIS